MTKTILCFGDSNTWGYDPATRARLPAHVRWTGILQYGLGNDYCIIEEGLNGRTTVWDDPVEGDKNGASHLPVCLESHLPLDIVIIMLGTNDLKHRFGVSAYDIACGAGVLVDIVYRCITRPMYGEHPKVLLVAPPPITRLTDFADMFAGAEYKSQKLGEHYQHVADEKACSFLDAGSIVRCSDLDGIHLDAAAHRQLGLAMAERVREMLQ